MKETTTEKILNKLQYLVLQLNTNKGLGEEVTNKMLLVIQEIKNLIIKKNKHD